MVENMPKGLLWSGEDINYTTTSATVFKKYSRNSANNYLTVMASVLFNKVTCCGSGIVLFIWALGPAE